MLNKMSNECLGCIQDKEFQKSLLSSIWKHILSNCQQKIQKSKNKVYESENERL